MLEFRSISIYYKGTTKWKISVAFPENLNCWNIKFHMCLKKDFHPTVFPWQNLMDPTLSNLQSFRVNFPFPVGLKTTRGKKTTHVVHKKTGRA